MATKKLDRSKLPMPEPRFKGKIGKTYKESKAEWPELPKPPKGAPNVVIILLDDVGFGQVSTFGGPVPTPHLDKLAAGGLRYNRFHTTAICVPSRAALITGRNHHNCGVGFLAEWATGFPSYNNRNEGMLFRDYYAEQSCTAGRAAFIMRQSLFHSGLSKVGLPGAALGMRAEDPTIAELLKPHGYVTGQFGKNHLGDRDKHLPTMHGFDEFFGNL